MENHKNYTFLQICIHLTTFVSMSNRPTNTRKKACAIRLDELKAPMQEEAMKIDRSLNWLVRLACKEFLAKRKKERKKTG